MRARTLLKATVLAGAAGFGYASVVERNWFALRQAEVPVLAAGAAPLRILHISDVHLTPGRHRLMSWLRSLDALEPDLVVNTGDSLGHLQAVQPFLTALGPLLDRPGVFVYGSNDLYSPTFRNPFRYLWGPSKGDHDRHVPDLPWRELGDSMESAGWFNANNHRGRIKLGDVDVEVAGVHDSHIGRDRYEDIAGRADRAADLRLGVMHSPEPAILNRFVADGFELLLAGHTHGGQVCIPGYGALVTNCGISRTMVSGLHRYPGDGSEPEAWLNVSAGLGTSPTAPVRFACRPEATLLTLVPGIS
ncbi:MAG TPA: metallophosphoesterase [Streptosporangiaceae bacterium]|jgi:predicted MPP superfamily phosphohydrolase|nr:metallophosphoesterase [Streptosporangiaceae bacterium]